MKLGKDSERRAGKKINELIFNSIKGKPYPEICPYCKRGRLIYENVNGEERIRCSYCGVIFEESPEYSPPTFPQDYEKLLSPKKFLFQREIKENPTFNKGLEDLVDILRVEGLEDYIQDFKKFYQEALDYIRKNLRIRRYRGWIFLAILEYYLNTKGIYGTYYKYANKSDFKKIRELLRALKRAFKGEKISFYEVIVQELSRKGIELPEIFVINSVYLLERLGIISRFVSRRIPAAIIYLLYCWEGHQGKRIMKYSCTAEEVGRLFKVASVTLRKYVYKIFSSLLSKKVRKISPGDLIYLRTLLFEKGDIIDIILRERKKYPSIRELYQSVSRYLSRKSSM